MRQCGDTTNGNAADRKMRNMRKLRQKRTEIRFARRHEFRFQRASVHRANAAHVGTRRDRRACFVERVRTRTDQEARACDTTRSRNRQIACAKMHAISIGGERDVESIIHHKCRARTDRIAHRAHVRDEFRGIHFFLANLYEINATFDRFSRDIAPIAPTKRARQQETKRKLPRARARDAQRDFRRQRVTSVAKRLCRASKRAVSKGLCRFFDNAQGLGKSPTCRLRHRGKIRAGVFVGALDCCADVAPHISCSREIGRRNERNGRLQRVAQRFRFFRDSSVVPRKPCDVLECPQRFTRAVRVGVDHAKRSIHRAQRSAARLCSAPRTRGEL